MNNIFYTDLFFVLFALLVTAILGFFIGWLLHGHRLKVLRKSLDTCYNMNRELKKKLVEFNSNPSAKRQVSSTYNPVVTNSSVSSSVSKSKFDGDYAKSKMGKRIKENDLKIVEGIGPKIEKLLQSDGIKSWEQLSKAPVSRLEKILKGGGDRYSMHKPNSWPVQSKLAFEGKWEQLKKLQDQ